MRKQIAGLALGLWLVPAVTVAQQEGATVEASPAVQGVPSDRWVLRMPADGRIEFHGMANFDAAGLGTAGMLYPAPGVAGLFAAILTHGVIVDAAKQKQKNDLQAAADQILEPYRPVLGGFGYRDLMRRALELSKSGAAVRIVEPDTAAGQEAQVDSVPTFVLTQDQTALVLENLVAIRRPGEKDDAAYRNVIRVVSAPRKSDEVPETWIANDGLRIKEESARLLAESLDIAFADVGRTGKPEAIPFKTVRYAEGGAEKIERAQILENRCDRLLIRTLRGSLMSVPPVNRQDGTAGPPCKVAMAGS